MAMTMRWYGFECTNHGAMKSKTKDLKCKRLDCSLSNITTFNFDCDLCAWITDGPMEKPEEILKQLKEPRTQDEYRNFFKNKSYNQLENILQDIQINIDRNTVGPIFYMELIRAMRNFKNSQ